MLPIILGFFAQFVPVITGNYSTLLGIFQRYLGLLAAPCSVPVKDCIPDGGNFILFRFLRSLLVRFFSDGQILGIAAVEYFASVLFTVFKALLNKFYQFLT